jgi:hypothetical protein
MQPAVGCYGYWHVEKIKVFIEIVDVREVYGRVDVLIQPTQGLGEQWVSAERISITQMPKEAAP